MMHHTLTRMLTFFIAVTPLFAADVELQLAYSDVVSGPLATTSDGNVPLADGCLGQIIEHVTDNPVTPPDGEGNPTGGDILFVIQKFDHAFDGTFRINGTEVLDTPGYFAITPAFQANSLPAHPVYLRVWNATNPAEATLYYETPLYAVGAGIQQVNFARTQLIACELGAQRSRSELDDPLSASPPPLAMEYNVLANYPNPFNAETTLSFALEHSAHVMIDLFDVQGREVKSVANDVFAAGEHRLSFQAPELTSGSYFAVLRMDGMKVSARRMTLLK